MTPAKLAAFLVSELPGQISHAIDLAAGDGALLNAAKQRWRDVQLYGIDCDQDRVDCALRANPELKMRSGDGLTIRFPLVEKSALSRLAVLGNPPFTSVEVTQAHIKWQQFAFKGVTSRHGYRRLEITFLSRALIEARKRDGMVAILMPSSFASGVMFGPYRRALLEQYQLLKAISIDGTLFRDTEASTVLLIVDTTRCASGDVEISRFSSETGKEVVHHGRVEGADRLDAKFWSAAALRNDGKPTLADCGVDVTRGRFCKAEAVRMKRRVLHTTDLCQVAGLAIELPDLKRSSWNVSDVFAEPGDILLSRTGTRVRWDPIEVKSGAAPITDHVLRIRAPIHLQKRVVESFRHPAFSTWLSSVSKGVCATVITKQELLQMPLFAN